jgi:hypothetical protein
MIWKTFKLYPDLHWLYFDVIIHTDRKSFIKATKDKDAIGLCRSWSTIYVDPKSRAVWHHISKPKIGEIHLFKGRCTVGISSHEICHAVHHYFWIRENSNAGKVMVDYRGAARLASAREESFCWVMGEMYRQFCVNFHAGKTCRKERQKTLHPVRKGTKLRSPV